MNTKQTEKKSNLKTSSSKPTKKTTTESPAKQPFNYFQMSESYTSLILGVVVVIITSILLIAFLRNRTNINTPQSTRDISTAMKVGPTISLADSISEEPIDVVSKSISQPAAPTVTPEATPTITVTNTPKPTVQPTSKPTAIPTKIIEKVTPTLSVRSEPTPAVAMTRSGQVTRATTYTTKSGDDLWAIAEKFYNSGYNWVDIAKANNITDANIIYSGMKLMIPAVEKDIATVTVTPTPTAMANLGKPVQNHVKTYTVKSGDDLWDVAVAVYKDGYRWSEIAKANNLTNPNVIHSGNVLKIP